jgi:uncharacterized protein (DUF924 family)
MTAAAMDGARAVREFWFGAPPWAYRKAWFVKDEAFDGAIRAGFGALVDAALQGPLGWGPAAPDRVAEILVLDQFPRNLFRGQARAFAGDPRARELARALVDGGDHRALHPLERMFAYLPFEHAEDLALQELSVTLYTALAAAHEGFAEVLDYAERHRDVIRRFGRFPHRNAALGRASTAEEQAYLDTPGSGF